MSGILYLVGVIVLALIASAVVRDRLARPDRARRLWSLAAERGLMFTRDDSSGLTAVAFSLFERGRRKDAAGSENLLVGAWDGVPIEAIDYWYAEQVKGSYGLVADTVRFSCAATQVRAALPPLTISREGVVSALADVVGLPDVDTELEDFNRAFDVRSSDRRFASAFLDQRMMSWLLEQDPALAFETRGRWLLIWRPQVEVDRLPELLEAAKAFHDHVPRVVFDLFRPGG